MQRSPDIWLSAANCTTVFKSRFLVQSPSENDRGIVKYGFEIVPRPADIGGGWRMRLIEDGEEVGGGVFPLAEYTTAEAAYEDALGEAEAWLNTRPC